MTIVHWIAELRFPILCALGLRLAASLWLAFIWLFLDPFFPRNEAVLKETYNHLQMHSSLIARMFLDVWLRWDAVHYMNLAWGGYANAGAADMNYWPLYFSLVRAVSPLFLNQTVLAGLFISTVATLIAAIFLWKLVLLLFQNQPLANWTVLLWVVFPTGIFLVAPFTDSLYACLALIALWAMVQKKWILAGIFCTLGGFTRSQGILLTLPFLLYIGIEHFKPARRVTWMMIVGLVLSPLGTIAFLIWRWQLGLQDFITSYTVYSNARIVDPFTGIFLAFQRFFRSPDLLMGSELFSILLFLGVQIWMLTKPVFRKQFPLMAYGVATLLFILIKHMLYATPLQSSNRYVLNILPAFIGFAYLYQYLPVKSQRLLITINVSLAMFMGVLYAMWIFVG